MNLNPEQLARAQEMMKNMKPDDLQNMFSTVQQNPQLFNQAMNMMQNNPNAQPGGPNPNVRPPASNVFSSYELINNLDAMKAKGNDKYNKGLYQEASTEYLAGIIDVESYRHSGSKLLSDSKFMAELNDIEIKLRNNYCTCKVMLEEHELIHMHAKEVLKLDEKSFKGNYHMAIACYDKCEYDRAKDHINKALLVNSNKKVEDLKSNIEQKLAELNKEDIKEDIAPEVNNQDIKKEVQQPLTVTEKENKVPTANEEEDDFEINQTKDFEKYFKNDPGTVTGNSKERSDENLSFEANTSTKPVEKPSTETTAKAQVQGSFFERNFQLLIGILIGLLISYLLRK